MRREMDGREIVAIVDGNDPKATGVPPVIDLKLQDL